MLDNILKGEGEETQRLKTIEIRRKEPQACNNVISFKWKGKMYYACLFEKKIDKTQIEKKFDRTQFIFDQF